ncbi:MAG: ABC transporter permease, partial [Anaerolineales bacterium]|nr:ABC transporter permease [Anaerolineales bacterium]
MALYLSFKEIWRNKGRFFLFSLVIALITFLVLFIAALGEGLASANKEYLDNLKAELLVFQENVDYSTQASRLEYNTLKNIRRLPGVADVGAIGFANTSILLPGGVDLDVSMVGVEAGKPGSPPAIEGEAIRTRRAKVVVIDSLVAESTGLGIGDQLTIKSIQGTEEKLYDFSIVGISASQKYFFQNSIFVPLQVWDDVQPKAGVDNGSQPLIPNIMAVRLDDPTALQPMSQFLEYRIDEVEVTDIKTAYQSSPGYSQQQGTLNTMKGFTFLIGVLVIGGFFQIQTLQKVPQIGMLKAIGTPNPIVAGAAIVQIILVTLFGVLIGSLATFG